MTIIGTQKTWQDLSAGGGNPAGQGSLPYRKLRWRFERTRPTTVKNDETKPNQLKMAGPFRGGGTLRAGVAALQKNGGLEDEPATRLTRAKI